MSTSSAPQHAPVAPAPAPARDWPYPIAALLAARGLADHDAAAAWLEARPPAQQQPLPDIDVAAERLARACRTGEQVAVYGDYDVDGLTSTTILCETLDAQGATAVPYIPARAGEGYGLNSAAVRRLAAAGVSLLVSVDCGITAHEELALAAELGMDAIVLDHHEAPPELPRALALVNPKLREGCGEPAACGVTLLTSAALMRLLARPWTLGREHLALAALGTVCDMVPLAGRERALVRHGLQALRQSRRPGLRALAREAALPLEHADELSCGWVLGPRLNAAGRLGDATLALELLRARTDATAGRLAAEIEQLNRRRRDESRAATARALELSADDPGPLLFVADEALSAGISGLVAAALSRERGLPAIAVALDSDPCPGSLRFPEGCDAAALLERHADLFLRSGGHARAAGFTLARSRVAEARERLRDDVALLGVPAVPAPQPDASLEVATLDHELLRLLELFAPHGPANPRPLFRAEQLLLMQPRTVGDGSHLQARIASGAGPLRAIGFGLAGQAPDQGQAVGALWQLRGDSWYGGSQVELLELQAGASGAVNTEQAA